MKKNVPAELGVKLMNIRLREWLNQHDMINCAKLCRRIPYNRGSFAHFEEGEHDLSIEAIEKVSELLLPYGFKG